MAVLAVVEALSARAARRSSAVALVAAALGVAALAVVEAAVQVAAAVPGRASQAAAAVGRLRRLIRLTERAAQLGPPSLRRRGCGNSSKVRSPQEVLETGRSFPGALFFGQNVINNECLCVRAAARAALCFASRLLEMPSVLQR